MKRLLVASMFTPLAAAAAGPAFADISWVFSQGPPAGAVVAGTENDGPLFLCQAPFADGVHPGKVVDGLCNIGYDGVEHEVGNFKWAVGNGVWGRPDSPGQPVVGGWENGHPLFVCKARFIDGYGTYRGVHPGKIVDGRCNITYGGAEVPLPRYQQFYDSGPWQGGQQQWGPPPGGPQGGPPPGGAPPQGPPPGGWGQHY